MLLSRWFERGHQPPSPSTSSTSVTPRCCTDLPPAGWGVCLDAAPSVWRSRARRSGRTTSPSSCSAGLCTGHSAGWTGCGSSAAAGSWPPRTAGPGWAGPGSAGLLSAWKKSEMFSTDDRRQGPCLHAVWGQLMGEMVKMSLSKASSVYKPVY